MKILDVVVSLVASALAGTGVGGGGLLVIYLTVCDNYLSALDSADCLNDSMVSHLSVYISG